MIENLPLTHEATDFQPAVTEISALARGFAANKEVYFFSDMQRSGWQQAGLATALDELRGRAALFMVRCGDTVPRNATIVSVEPQASVLHAGDRVSVVVLVRNTGAEPLSGLGIRLSTSDLPDEVATASIDLLAPGETQSVVLSTRLARLQVVLLKSITTVTRQHVRSFVVPVTTMRGRVGSKVRSPENRPAIT